MTSERELEQWFSLVRSSSKASLKSIDAIRENFKFHAPRQIQRAKMARRLMHAMGFPTLRKLREFIRLNIARDNTVTLANCEIAECVFGPDQASMMGRTTRRRPNPVNED